MNSPKYLVVDLNSFDVYSVHDSKEEAEEHAKETADEEDCSYGVYALTGIAEVIQQREIQFKKI